MMSKGFASTASITPVRGEANAVDEVNIDFGSSS